MTVLIMMVNNANFLIIMILKAYFFIFFPFFFFLSCCDEVHHMLVIYYIVLYYHNMVQYIRHRDVTLGIHWSCSIRVCLYSLSIIRTPVLILCAYLQVFFLPHARAK